MWHNYFGMDATLYLRA